MKPEDFREIVIKPGRLLGLIGDYNAPSTWTHNEQVQVTLERYVVAEWRWLHYPGMEEKGVLWDAAAIASFSAPFETIGIEPEGERLVVNELLLFLRHSSSESWDDDRVVVVYGVKKGESFDEGPFLEVDWQPKVVWLSAAAVMTLEDTPNLCEYSRAIHRSQEWRKLKTMLDAGLITEEEYKAERDEVLARYPY